MTPLRLAHSAHVDGTTPLYFATSEGRVAVAEALLEAGAAPYLAGHNFQPLHIAAFRNVKMLEVFRALVERGADLDAADASGETPIQRFVEPWQSISFLY